MKTLLTAAVLLTALSGALLFSGNFVATILLWVLFLFYIAMLAIDAGIDVKFAIAEAIAKIINPAYNWIWKIKSVAVYFRYPLVAVGAVAIVTGIKSALLVVLFMIGCVLLLFLTVTIISQFMKLADSMINSPPTLREILKNQNRYQMEVATA